MGAPDPFPEPPDDADADAATEPPATPLTDPQAEAWRPMLEAGRRKGGAAGAVMAGAMLAMRDLLEGPKKQEIPIEVEASGEPHDLDRDGVGLAVDGVEVAAPPLERKQPLPPATRRRRR